MKKAAVRLLSALFGVAAGLLLAEAGIAIANRWFPYFYAFDAQRGWALKPGVAGWWRREGGAYVSINRDGFRGPDLPKAKPPGTVRIAVLGDSYVQATQVPYEKTFPQVIARNLARCPALGGRRVEALNFGVDGYGTAQELITLKQKALAYSPDIVVLAIFLGNDVRNNSIRLEESRCRPFYVYRDGKLVAVGPFETSKSFRLWCMAQYNYRHSGILALLGDAWRVLRERRARPSADYPMEPALNYNIYLPPPDQAWRQAWRVTEGLIAETAEVAAARHALFLAATLDTGIQVWPAAGPRQRFERMLGVADLFYPDRRIAALGAREGFAVLALAEPLQRYAEQHHAYLHGFSNTPMGFGHWNALGHRVAGRLLAAKLCAMLNAGGPATDSAPAKPGASR